MTNKRKFFGKENPFFGKHHTEETKNKIRLTRFGTKASLETRKKLSIARQKYLKNSNYTPWNKGLTKENDSRLKYTKEHNLRVSIARKGISFSEIHKQNLKRAWQNLEVRKKHSDGMKRAWQKPGRMEKHKKHMKKIKPMMCAFMKNGHAAYMNSKIKQISKPQKQLYEFIKHIYPKAKMNYPIKFWTNRWCALDIAIPKFKINYEFDGDYWHCKPEQKVRDSFRDELLIERGWCVVRIKGKEELNQIIGGITT